jgi:hypothetical protein
MSTALANRRAGPGAGRPGRADRGEPATWPSLFETAGGEPTLDEVLSGVWEGLAAHQAVSCPVCGAVMEPRYGAHALPIGGTCRTCDTELT